MCSGGEGRKQGPAGCAEVALAVATGDVQLMLERLAEEGDGARRRNLITDELNERNERAICRLERLADRGESLIGRLTDLHRLDIDIKNLTTAILKEAADEKPLDRGKGRGRIKVKTRRGEGNGGQVPPSQPN